MLCSPFSDVIVLVGVDYVLCVGVDVDVGDDFYGVVVDGIVTDVDCCCCCCY